MDQITFQLPRWLPLLAGALAVAAVATTWWYRAQARQARVSGPWGVTLIALRIAALAILALALLRPSVPRAIDPADAGAIVVLVDRSRSMGIRDIGRSSGNLDLLEALGMLPPGTPSVDESAAAGLRPATGRLRDAQQAVAVGLSELDYARLSGRQSAAIAAGARLRSAAEELRRAIEELSRQAAPLPQSRPLIERCAELLHHVEALPQAAALDVAAGPSPTSPVAGSAASASGSGWLRQGWDLVNRAGSAAELVRGAAAEERLRDDPALRDASERLARQSRIALALRALTAADAGLLARLNPATPVHLFALSDMVKPLPVPNAPPSDLSLDANGTASDIFGAVREVRRRLADQDVRAVVVFSDGRQNATTTTPSAGGALSSDGPPVFAVQCARGSARDIAITRVSLPHSALAGETVNVRVDVRAIGPRPDVVEVRADAGDGVPPATRAIDLSVEDHGSAEIPLELSGAASGIARRVVVSINPDPAELTADNNRVERWLKVVNAPLRVALISGSAGWEYQYVRSALARRRRWVTLTESLLINESGGDPSSAPKWNLSPDQIDQQELVLMIDVSPDAISSEQWAAVRRMVSDRGGGLILVAGDEHLPAKWTTHRIAAELLAFAAKGPPAWKTWPGETPGYVVAPPAGLEGPDADAVSLADDATDSARRWDELPALWRYASVSSQLLKPSARALLVESSSRDPILIEQRLGLGRVLLMMTNETWRWRYKAGERDHDRLWLQLVRHAAEEPYALQAGQSVAFDVDRVAASRGEGIRVRARFAATVHGTPRVEVSEADRVVRTEPLRPADSSPGAPSTRFEAQLTGLPAGEYRLRLQTDDSSAATDSSMSLPLHVYEGEDGGVTELADVSGDDANLRRLVAGTGGEMIRLDQIATLPDRIDRAAAVAQRARAESEESWAVPPVRSSRGQYRLWDSPYLFLVVLGLLGVEWAVRKRIGLA